MFYDLFHSLCTAKGVTPTQVARDLGLRQSTVSMWKKQGTTPKYDTLRKLAEYFDVSVDELVGGRDVEVPVEASFTESMGGTVKAITFDDFAHAMQAEAEQLTEADKQILLSLAKQLNEARRQRAQDAPQSPPASTEGTDTTSTPDAPETPSEGH